MPELHRVRFCAAAFTAFLLVAVGATRGNAASITSVTGTASAAVTAVGGSPDPSEYYTSAAFSETCGAGCSAFDAALQAGAGLVADPGQNLRIDTQWTWTVDVVVDATATQAWELTADTKLLGYLTAVDQGGGSTRARLTNATGTLDAGGTGTTGSMGLAGTDSMSASGNANQMISRMGTFSVIGGFGPQTVSMTFTLDGRLRSQCTGGSCGTQGDEVAIRLGVPGAGTPAGFSAGNYPGPDGDPTAAHGMFISMALVLLPEPGSLWLAASALAALALTRRCRA